MDRRCLSCLSRIVLDLCGYGASTKMYPSLPVGIGPFFVCRAEDADETNILNGQTHIQEKNHTPNSALSFLVTWLER